MSDLCTGDDCLEFANADGLCDGCEEAVIAEVLYEVVHGDCGPVEAPVEPEPAPVPVVAPKARRAPRKAATKPAGDVDWKAMYELASQNIRAMCAAGAFIPGVTPKCSCPHCPDAFACGIEQVGPIGSLARQGAEAFDS